MTVKMTPQVVGVGQCSLDILGQVDRYPELDQKVELSSLLIQGGGPVATALVTLARLGVPVAMAGATGDDEFGRQIRCGLEKENVDCTRLIHAPGSASQIAFIAVDDAGHRNIFWHRGDVSPTIPDSLADLLPDGARILHLDGLHLDVAVAAAELARTRDVTTVLDAGTLRPGMTSLLPLIDHLVVSARFARQILPGEDAAALSHLAGYGARAVTITGGKSGSLSMGADGRIFHQPAFTVDVVDTTGCGDVFHGGYIYGLLQEWSLPEIVRFAAACAALKTRAMGGRTAIPRLLEVQDFLQNHEEC
jgi:ribokinase